MVQIIEDHKLKETRWEEGCEDRVVVIPEGVQHLLSYCLDSEDEPQKIPDLQAVVIPNTVRQIEADAFCDADKLMALPHLYRVHFRGTLREWCAIDKGWNSRLEAYTYIGIDRYELYLQDESGREYLAENLVIPEDIPTISPCAFEGCDSLKTVDVPGDVALSRCAFSRCRNLYRIRFQGDVSLDQVWDCFEPGDQTPFDETEDLEILLSDAAAESFIRSEYFNLWTTPIRMMLMDREETLSEILEIVEDLEEEYHYKYGIPIGQDIIPTYREFLRISQRERSEESDSYDEESDAERNAGDGGSEPLLPGGYHYDERMSLRAKVFHGLIVCYRKLYEYRGCARKVAAEAKALQEPAEALALYRRLPNLYSIAEEIEELLAEIDAHTDEWIERGALDVSETIYDRIDDIRVSIEGLCEVEGRLGECGCMDWNIDWPERSRLQERCMDEFRSDADLLRECAEDVVEALWRLLQDEQV